MVVGQAPSTPKYQRRYWKTTLRQDVPFETSLAQRDEIGAGEFTACLNGIRTDNGRRKNAIYKGRNDETHFSLGLHFMEDYMDSRFIDNKGSINFNRNPVYTFERDDLDMDTYKDSRYKEDLLFWHEACFAIKLNRSNKSENVEGELLSSSKSLILDECKGAGGDIIRLLFEFFDQIDKKLTIFLEDNRMYLWSLAQKCQDVEDVSPSMQLEYTRELHQMNARYVGLKRRIDAAKEAARFVAQHPFFSSETGSYLRSKFNSAGGIIERLDKQARDVLEHINEARTLSTDVVSLTNIKELSAATEIARNARLVALLGLLFLPPALTAAVFGMNVYEITGQPEQHHIWIFGIVLAFFAVVSFTVSLYLKYIDNPKVSTSPHNRFYRAGAASQQSGWFGFLMSSWKKSAGQQPRGPAVEVVPQQNRGDLEKCLVASPVVTAREASQSPQRIRRG